MGSVVDLSKEQDLEGCVSAPLFMSELMRCLSEDVKKPAATILQISGAERALPEARAFQGTSGQA